MPAKGCQLPARPEEFGLRLLDPITPDACCFFEDHVVIADESLPLRKRGAAPSPWSATPARRSPPPSKG
jgi:hypothetical protein